MGEGSFERIINELNRFDIAPNLNHSISHLGEIDWVKRFNVKEFNRNVYFLKRYARAGKFSKINLVRTSCLIYT
jgi:hypothetical protein